MVNEKKPSIYSDRSAIGSADELDEYGVWVKSGPQDLSTTDIGGQEFADLSMPDFDMGFGDGSPGSDMSFPDIPDTYAAGRNANAPPDLEVMDLQIPEIDFSEAESEIVASNEAVPDVLVSQDGFDAGFDELNIPEEESAAGLDIVESAGEESVDVSPGIIEDVPGGWDQEESSLGFIEHSPVVEEQFQPELKDKASSPDLSTQLLMKIADDLASIRSELSHLKEDFAGIRVEVPTEEKTEVPPHGGFFSEEDDEKIALTGDELDNILNTTSFTEETTETGEPDVELSLLEESESELAIPDEMDGELSFTEVRDEVTENSDGDFVQEESAIEDTETAEPSASDEDVGEEIDIDFDDLGIDLNTEPADFDKAREENSEDQSLANMALDLSLGEFADDNLDLTGEENLMLEENLFDENSTEENLFTEESLLKTDAETETGEIVLTDEIADSEILYHLRSQGVEPMETPPEKSAYLEEDPLATVIDESEFAEDISLDEDQDFDAASLDLSEAVIDEPDLSADIIENPVEEPFLDDISLDGIGDINIELEDEQLETEAEENIEVEPELPIPEDIEESETLELNLADEGDSLAQVIPEGFEVSAEESQVPLDDDLDAAFVGEAALDISAGTDEPVLETSAGIMAAEDTSAAEESLDIPSGFKNELKTVLSYMDHLLESLPEEKIEEFAKSEYFDTYKKLFKELGLV
jgi:hypothetical protein